MHIQVTGKQIDVGDALRFHVEDRFTNAIAKYSENPIDSVVTFSKDRHEFKCDASAHLSTGLFAQASAKADDIYAAADGCCERLEKQLRRYKRRLKDHHKSRSEPISAMEASAYVLAGRRSDDEEPDGDEPIVIAEMKERIQSLTVGEAVMQMEMADKPFLLFKNHKNGGMNVVFRRDDGNIGWIDPANLSDA